VSSTLGRRDQKLQPMRFCFKHHGVTQISRCRGLDLLGIFGNMLYPCELPTLGLGESRQTCLDLECYRIADEDGAELVLSRIWVPRMTINDTTAVHFLNSAAL
jgi:hypothetical protein